MTRQYRIRRRYQWGGGWEWSRCGSFEVAVHRLGCTLFWYMAVNKVVYPLERGAQAAAYRDKVASELEL